MAGASKDAGQVGASRGEGSWELLLDTYVDTHVDTLCLAQREKPQPLEIAALIV